MGIIQCVIYIVCLNNAGARPVTDSSSWMDLIFLTGNKEAVQTEVGQEQEPSSGAPLLHSEFCGTRPGFSDSGRRIVGGSLARAGEVPWQASLARTEAEGSGLTPVCGAAVVSARAVLTAAHCLKLAVSSYRILVGRTSLLTPECGAQVMDVRGYNLHPAFSPRTLDNDLAVVEVHRPKQASHQTVVYDHKLEHMTRRRTQAAEAVDILFVGPAPRVTFCNYEDQGAVAATLTHLQAFTNEVRA